ncbi:MAG: hypothetical protein AAF907_07690 [Planctomycetota bacterium]
MPAPLVAPIVTGTPMEGIYTRAGREQLASFIAALAVLTLGTSSASGGDRGKLMEMVNAASQVIHASSKVCEFPNHEYGLDHRPISMTYLPVGGVAKKYETLKAGERYCLAATGGANIRDIDIDVKEEGSSRILAKERASGSVSILEFVPESTTSYEITIKLCDASRDGFCGFVALRDGGDYPVAEKYMLQAMQNAINKAGFHPNKKLGFCTSPYGCWCMDLMVIDEGKMTTSAVANLGSGERRVVAAGDEDASDLDLSFWQFDKGGDVRLDLDIEDDAHPTVEGSCRSGLQYRYKVSNETSVDAAAAAVCVLILVP